MASSSKRPRCSASTKNNIRCRKPTTADGIYCSLHSKKSAETKQDEPSPQVVLQEDEGPPLLPKELWILIAENFTVLDIRPLFLTCRPLFNLFTSDEWYQPLNHRRYLFINSPQTGPLVTQTQDEISIKVGYRWRKHPAVEQGKRRPFLYLLPPDWKEINEKIATNYYGAHPSELERPDVRLMLEVHHAIYVVTNHVAAEQLYYFTRLHGDKVIIFDANSDTLVYHVNLARAIDEAYEIVLSQLRANLYGSKPLKKGTINANLGHGIHNPVTPDQLGELVAKKLAATVDVTYRIKGELIYFYPKKK